jgi:hypothetical protein
VIKLPKDKVQDYLNYGIFTPKNGKYDCRRVVRDGKYDCRRVVRDGKYDCRRVVRDGKYDCRRVRVAQYSRSPYLT